MGVRVLASIPENSHNVIVQFDVNKSPGRLTGALFF
jgi:hypothetical protein